MSSESIVCSNLSKSYFFYDRPLFKVVDILVGFPGRHARKFDALSDVSFSVGKGQSFGIVGRNGSGKSTLLKIISGVVQQTSGSVQVQGKVASLLELGTGFHGEFTGRQNLFTNARLMGLSDEVIQERIPEIIAFSELGDFIDRKVRTYSSGMLLRLGFSLTTHVAADILIVDEALAVGDAAFQAKCIKRIRKWVHEEGRTLLYVSHDPGTVKMLCTHAILLAQGKVIGRGAPDVVLDHYNALLSEDSKIEETSLNRAYQGKGGIVSGEDYLDIIKVRIVGHDNQEKKIFVSGEPFCLEFVFKTTGVSLNNPTIGFHIRDIRGYEIFGTNTYLQGTDIGLVEPGETRVVRFHGRLDLGRGNYTIGVAVHEGLDHTVKNHKWMDKAYTFEVIDDHRYRFDGVTRIHGSFASEVP